MSYNPILDAIEAGRNPYPGKAVPSLRESLPAAEKSSGLPDEIKNKQYENERQLLEDLESCGLRDLRIVLDNKGFAVWQEMPGEQHSFAVEELIDRFDEWKNGRALKGKKSCNIFLQDSYNEPKNHYRVADFAIYGPDRLNGIKIRKVSKKGVNPHVIFQFSWTNDIIKEATAVDDIMNFAGVGEYEGLGRPSLAYLIKAMIRGREKDSPVYGFDVYKVGQGQYTPDVPTIKYRVGAEENTAISVSPTIMGLTDDPGEPLRIEMRSIRQELENLGTLFVNATEDEM